MRQIRIDKMKKGGCITAVTFFHILSHQFKISLLMYNLTSPEQVIFLRYIT